MLRKRINKYNLPLREDPNPTERRKDLTKEALRDSTFFPKPVEYKDIDEAFFKWVDEELRIVFEGEALPTYALFSNQRFTEFAQMWDNVDDADYYEIYYSQDENGEFEYLKATNGTSTSHTNLIAGNKYSFFYNRRN